MYGSVPAVSSARHLLSFPSLGWLDPSDSSQVKASSPINAYTVTADSLTSDRRLGWKDWDKHPVAKDGVVGGINGGI